MEQDQKRIFLAVVLSGIFIFAWQKFFPPAAPPVEKTQAVTTQAAGANTQTSTTTATSNTEIKEKEPVIAETNLSPVEEKEVVIGNEETHFLVDQNFAVIDAKSKFSKKDFQTIVGTKRPFFIEVLKNGNYVRPNFTFSETARGAWIAKSEEHGIEMRLNEGENGVINYAILGQRPQSFRFIFKSVEKELENRQVRNFYYLDDELNTIQVGDDSKGEALVRWAGIDFDYHLFVFTFSEKLSSTYTATEDGFLKIKLNKPQTQLKGSLVFSHKEYDHLNALGDNLNLAVDFGMWSILAVPILRGLQFFYDFIPNYGIAIILITLILRLVTFPLQYKSIKSMKKMQTIQPELNRLKEKFKDDPQRMQKETMELFKKSGYNPLGGCLPMLLQIPVFFAFYRVLYNAVELVNAPFFGWIHDLSNKDPYYVLPVLMGVAFFGQQKLTPTPTADPTQAKVMMFMPLVFTFIMKDLPSGLTLYIFVSTLFGILQQFFMQRSK